MKFFNSLKFRHSQFKARRARKKINDTLKYQDTPKYEYVKSTMSPKRIREQNTWRIFHGKNSKRNISSLVIGALVLLSSLIFVSLKLWGGR